MIRRPPRSTQSRSSAASDVYKRQELDERIEGQVPLDAEVTEPELQIEPGAELRRVGGDREVPLDAQLGHRGVDDVDRHPPRHRDGQRRRGEGRVETTDAEHEVGIVAERGEDRHLALDGEEEDARVVDRGEEVDPALVELDRADEVDLQHDHGDVVGGQGDPQDADDRDVAGDLDDHPEGQADQGGRSPADLCLLYTSDAADDLRYV